MPLAAIALASVSGCVRSGRDDVDRTQTTSIVIAVDAGSASVASSVSDEDLATDLRAALASDDTLSLPAREIDVSVVNGKVTLRGRVANPREHDDVLAKARRLGAVAIVDELRPVRPKTFKRRKSE